MSDLMDTLRALQMGDRTIEEVAADFRTRSWPKGPQTPDTADAALAAEATDRDPDPAGSFAEVAGAFYQGIITVDQYGVLLEAATEGAKAEPTEPVVDPDAPEEPEESEEPAEGTDDDPDADTEGDTEPPTEDTGEDKPGKPKKGVNPFPPKPKGAKP